jgi:hypothetical protein
MPVLFFFQPSILLTFRMYKCCIYIKARIQNAILIAMGEEADVHIYTSDIDDEGETVCGTETT